MMNGTNFVLKRFLTQNVLELSYPTPRLVYLICINTTYANKSSSSIQVQIRHGIQTTYQQTLSVILRYPLCVNIELDTLWCERYNIGIHVY